MTALNRDAADAVERAAALLRRKVRLGAELADRLARDLRAVVRDRYQAPAGRTLVREETECMPAQLVESGWVVRSRVLPLGGRQIVGVALPGDFFCHNRLLQPSVFDHVARTEVTAIRLEPPAGEELHDDRPALAAALAWAAAQEEALLAERVVSLGRRDSLQKLAHFLCELAARLRAIGRMTDDRLRLPLNQEDFADLLGISVIHINRTFRRLAEEGAADYRKGEVVLRNRLRLVELSGFSRSYLSFLAPQPA
jgi:CRP-like cAMP-binding protein